MNRTSRQISLRSQRVVRSLGDLSLSAADLAGLRHQGSVCREQRGAATYYKLRFRSADGRQHVRYLGQDATLAARIRVELQELQFRRRRIHALQRSDADARKLLRRGQQQLRAGLEQLGFHFHGLEIRRRRADVAVAGVEPPLTPSSTGTSQETAHARS